MISGCDMGMTEAVSWLLCQQTKQPIGNSGPAMSAGLGTLSVGKLFVLGLRVNATEI